MGVEAAGQARGSGLSTAELLEQLHTRFQITADFNDGCPPLDFETSLFALGALIPAPELLRRMRPGSSWSITRLEDQAPLA